VNLYKKRERGIQFLLDNPKCASRIPAVYKVKHIIHEAVRFWEFYQKNPQMTRKELANKFDISLNKVFVLKSLMRKLPPDFIKIMNNCQNEKFLQKIGRQKLEKIIQMNCLKERRKAIQRLMNS